MTTDIKLHGWTAVPRSFNDLLQDVPKIDNPEPLLVKDISWPADDTVERVRAYAQAELPEQTYNHSMRAYYFGKDENEACSPPFLLYLANLGHFFIYVSTTAA